MFIQDLVLTKEPERSIVLGQNIEKGLKRAVGCREEYGINTESKFGRAADWLHQLLLNRIHKIQA